MNSRDDCLKVVDRFRSDAFGRLLVVVYTRTREGVRMISARRATRRERERYQERL